MKKIILFLLSIATLASCSDKHDNIDEPQKLKLNETEVTLSYETTTKLVEIETNVDQIIASVPDADKSWCSVKITDDKKLEIKVEYNESTKQRQTKVSVKAGLLTGEVAVTQEFDPFLTNEDIQLKVASAETTSEEIVNDKTGIDKSFDGDLSTIWHSKWSDGGKFPITATYNLENADILDYILYYPRGDGYNGHLGKVEIWIATDAKPELTKVMDFDYEEKGAIQKVDLPESVVKPKTVQFIINSGKGGFTSCAEMQFYEKVEPSTAKYIDIPVSSAGYTEPDEYKSNVSQTMKLKYAPQDKALGKIFFKFTEAGEYQLELKVRNSVENKKVKVTLGDFTTDLELPITTGYKFVKLIRTNFTPTEDYSSLILENLSSGDIEVESLRILGEKSESVNYNNHPTARRNAVSVHLGYQLGDIKNVEWFYNEVTVPKGFDAPYHSFYMVNGWGKGYSGIQVRDKSGKNSKRWFIFSCWNTKETSDPAYHAKVEKYGDNVTVESFGGEGTGAKTYLEIDWVTEKTYQFVLQARVVGTSAYYSMFWKAKDEKDWKFQATILSPHNPAFLSGLYSFVENYIGEDGHYQRKANYSNQWVKNATGWQQLTRARFTQDGGYTYRQDIGASTSKNGYYLWNGGYLAGESTFNTILTREASENVPPISDAELEGMAKMSLVP